MHDTSRFKPVFAWRSASACGPGKLLQGVRRRRKSYKKSSGDRMSQTDTRLQWRNKMDNSLRPDSQIEMVGECNMSGLTQAGFEAPVVLGGGCFRVFRCPHSRHLKARSHSHSCCERASCRVSEASGALGHTYGAFDPHTHRQRPQGIP